jgi:hypothetical protein
MLNAARQRELKSALSGRACRALPANGATTEVAMQDDSEGSRDRDRSLDNFATRELVDLYHDLRQKQVDEFQPNSKSPGGAMVVDPWFEDKLRRISEELLLRLRSPELIPEFALLAHESLRRAEAEENEVPPLLSEFLATEQPADPPEEPTTNTVCPFKHSEDYCTVSRGGEPFSLTSRQAQMIQILHRAYQDGKPDVAIASILEQLETKNGRWQDTFRSRPGAKKALIKSGMRRGTLRLNL